MRRMVDEEVSPNEALTDEEDGQGEVDNDAAVADKEGSVRRENNAVVPSAVCARATHSNLFRTVE